jgi:ubiquinone/menaquinone biosynthesis C-methylase UbiE
MALGRSAVMVLGWRPGTGQDGVVSNDSIRPDPATRSRMVAALFDRVAQTYDSVGVPWFTPIAEGLVRELNPSPGEEVLDLGSGRGAALFPLAEAVGPTGHVIGVDLAEGMVAALRSDVAARGLSNVDVRRLDAAAPDLGGRTFDLLASSLVLFFLPDPAAAVLNWYDLLVLGGRVGVSSFGAQDPAWLAVDSIFTPFLPKHLLDARTSGTSGPFGSDAGVAGLFKAAGFADVRTTHLDVTVTFRDADQWYGWSWSHGQRAMWESVPEERRSEVRTAAAKILEAARTGADAITLTQQVRYTLATRS